MGEESRSTKIFVSYSRKDKIFARKLYEALKEAGIDPWVDWEGIPLSADWMKEITTGIEGSDAFVFIISPDSVKSKVCADELGLAIKNNKKIVPVLHKEPEKGQKIHPKLASTNWVYMRSKKDDFKATVPKLIEAIQTDLGWVQQHTRLTIRATEWTQKNRNSSYLLQGSDLEDGEHWMTGSNAAQGREATPLQTEYILTSRKDAVKRQRNFTTGVGIALFLSILLGIYAFQQSIEASKSRDEAKANLIVAEEKEHARATQQAVAEEQRQEANKQKTLAEENAKKANAQRSAAEAKIYQDRIGQLYTSTLLAVNALQQLPDLDDAENILRHNINLLPIPVNQMDGGDYIWTIEPSPDQEYFITADTSGKACVWSMEDGTNIFCTDENDGQVFDTAMNEDGTILAVATDKGILGFWDVATQKIIKKLQLKGAIYDLKLHPSGKWLGVGLSGGISLINMSTLKEEISFVQNGDVKAIDFDDTGKYMVIGTSKGYVSIWEVMGGKTIAGAKHSNEVIDVAISPDGKWVVSVGADSTVRATLISSGGQKYAVTQGDWVEDVTFGPDSSWFVTASDDNTVRVFNTATGQERFRVSHAHFASKVRVSKDGQWLASTGYDDTVRVWDSATGAEVMQVPIADHGTSLRFDKAGNRLIVGDQSGNITLWDISSLKARTGFIQFSEYLHKAIFNPSGEWLVTNSDDKNVWIIESDKLGLPVDDRRKLFSFTAFTYDMVISPDSKWIATVEFDSGMPEYNRVILASVDGQKKKFLSHNGEVINTMEFTSDSSQVITVDENGLINLWSVESGQKLSAFNAGEAIISLAVSPNGKYLITGMEDGNHSIVWDLATQTKITDLEQIGTENSVQFSRDGKLLATGSSESSVYLWNAEGGTFSRIGKDITVNGEVSTMSFNSDNTLLGIGDNTGYVYLIDLVAGQEVDRLPHVDNVTSISFSPDGNHLVTVARKTMLLWDLQILPRVTRENLIEIACTHLIRNFNAAELKFFFAGEEKEHQRICPNLPVAGEN